jgi:hypothetical protein
MDSGFLPLLVAAAMVWTTLSLLKHLRAAQYGDAVTIVVLVLVGVGIAVLARESSFASDFNLAGASLADCVFVGFGFSSTARATYEFKKSLDNSDNAREPKLFPNPPASE